MAFDITTAKPLNEKNYGKRLSGEPKGEGYFGELKRPGGGISTELSIGVNIDGKEIEIPSLVPTLDKNETDYLLAGNKPTQEIVNKAVRHAQQRIAQGKSPFAGENEKKQGFDITTAKPLQEDVRKPYNAVPIEQTREAMPFFPQPQTQEELILALNKLQQKPDLSRLPLDEANQFLRAISQREESAVAQPLLEAQRASIPERIKRLTVFGLPENIKAITKGLTGQTAGELGDVGRQAGLPESLSAAGGLLASAFLPSNILLSGKTATKAIKTIPRKSTEQLTREATSTFRSVLRPTKGEIGIELRKGKDIDDLYKLAAEEQLPINQSIDKKNIDTTLARQQLKPKQNIVHQNLKTELARNKTKQFDIKKIGQKAKQELRERIKDDAEYDDAITAVDKQINKTIRHRGRYLNGEQLNDFKQGKWAVSYKADKPIESAIVPRKLGHIAKETIEKSYPGSNIKELNELSSKYASLAHLLENAQGRVVQGGALGKYFARATGAVVGGTVGTAIPLPGIGPAAGALAGQWAGAQALDYLRSPSRLSRIASKKARKAGIKEKSFRTVQELPRKPKGPGPITEAELVGVPQPIDQGPVYIAGALPPPQQKIPKITPEALPSPRTAGAKVMTKADIAKAIKDLKAPVTPTKQRGKFPDERVNKVIYMFDKESQGMLPPKKPVQRTKAEIEGMRKDLEQKVKEMLRAQSAAEKRRLEKIAREKYLQWKASGLTTEGGKGGVIQ